MSSAIPKRPDSTGNACGVYLIILIVALVGGLIHEYWQQRHNPPSPTVEETAIGSWESLVDHRDLYLDDGAHQARLVLQVNDKDSVQSVGTWWPVGSDVISINVNGPAGPLIGKFQLIEGNSRHLIVRFPQETAPVRDSFIETDPPPDDP